MEWLYVIEGREINRERENKKGGMWLYVIGDGMIICGSRYNDLTVIVYAILSGFINLQIDNMWQ